MASLITRVTAGTGCTVKNAPLSNAEIDTNFITLNDTKLENTWTGNTTVTTLGTVTTGTWNATTIAVNKGGTGLSTAPSNGSLLIGNGTSYTLTTLTGTTNQIAITNGAGSIQLTTPQDIGTSSQVQFGSLGIGTAAPTTGGEIRATGDVITSYSDERLKENIKPIENALDKVLQLDGVTYNTNALAESFGYINKDQQIGLLAGKVKMVLPECVKPAPFDTMYINETQISRSGENYLTVQYEKIVPVLVEAIKELNKKIEILENR